MVSILEQARSNVVRSVNTNMVAAYWLIGREIVEEIQGGKGRAEYGEKVIEQLSRRLTERYGKGFSEPNMQWFRKFYLAYRDRIAIPYPMGTESDADDSKQIISRPAGVESGAEETIPHPLGTELTLAQKSHPMGGESPQGFLPRLTDVCPPLIGACQTMGARGIF